MSRDQRPEPAAKPIPLPRRCVDREGAAAYLHSSTDTIDRLIGSGALPVVRLPVQRHRKTGAGVAGLCRRVLIDLRDLDALIDRCKELGC